MSPPLQLMTREEEEEEEVRLPLNGATDVTIVAPLVIGRRRELIFYRQRLKSEGGAEALGLCSRCKRTHSTRRIGLSMNLNKS